MSIMIEINREVRSELFVIEEMLNKKTRELSDISLMSGKAGAVLFYESLFRLTNNNKYFTKTQEVLEDIFDTFNNSKTQKNFSFSTGLAGLAYTFQTLSRSNPVWEEQLAEALLVFDKLILEFTEDSVPSMNNIDFLHGSLGAVFYLNERIQANSGILNITIELFETISKAVHEYVSKLDCLNHDEAVNSFEFGLAHGCASIIVVLSKALINMPSNPILKKTLLKVVNYVLKFKSKNPDSLSVFPTNIYGVVGYQNPLSWCRGDQGIAYSLTKAAETLEDSALMQEAKYIALRTLKRDSLEKAMYQVENCSTGLCHGISSIAYLHKKSFSYTKNDSFIKNYYSLTKDLLARKAEYSHNESSFGSSTNTKNEITFLNGLIGIGLFYIDFLEKDKSPIWEGVLLLD